MQPVATSPKEQPGIPPERPPLPAALRLRELVIEPPLLNASGAFDVAATDPDWRAEPATARPLGAYVTKTVTRAPRAGNPRPWVDQLAAGTLVNSVGLANPGIDAIRHEWSWLPRAVGCPIVLSIGGSAAELCEIVRLAQRLPWVAAYELNLSCPNVRGADEFAAGRAARVEEAVRVARAVTSRPLLVKLSPASGELAMVARAAEEAGADAITAVNTMPIRALDDDGEPLLGVPDGGMSGQLLHPIALRVVATIAASVELPVVGVGGVGSRAAARRMFAAGALAVGVGSAAAIAPSVIADVAAMWDPASR